MPNGLVRFHESGDFHFITFSCYRRQAYFDLAEARECFEEALEQVRQRYSFVVAGYVVMPEHIHMLTSEPKQCSLATALQVLKQKTSRRLKAEGDKAFWQHRYHDFNVWSAGKLREKLKYLHRNPVQRGLVQKPEDWLWSSFLHYSTGAVGTVEIESEWTALRREKTHRLLTLPRKDEVPAVLRRF